MTAAPNLARRGACPSLDQPMVTGDGLLVRLTLATRALRPTQWAALTTAAAVHGNGRLEISRRGNLQLRGLAADRMAGLATAIVAAKIALAAAPPIEIHPLAGRIPGAVADPRPLAAALRAAVDAATWGNALPAKTSVVIDGGGAWTLAGLGADCRLTALDGAAWRLTCGAHDFGPFDAARAAAATLKVLATLAAGRCRARDLPASAAAFAGLPRLAPAPAQKTDDLIGVHRLADGDTLLVTQLPFGGAMAANLARFGRAAAKAGANALHPAPGKTLLVTGLTPASASRLRTTAEACDLITAADDRRRWVVTCAGQPACGQAHLDTVEIARRLIANLDPADAFGGTVHISGCAKGCARPPAPAAEIIGTTAGPQIIAAAGLAPDLRAQLTVAAEEDR